MKFSPLSATSTYYSFCNINSRILHDLQQQSSTLFSTVVLILFRTINWNFNIIIKIKLIVLSAKVVPTSLLNCRPKSLSQQCHHHLLLHSATAVLNWLQSPQHSLHSALKDDISLRNCSYHSFLQWYFLPLSTTSNSTSFYNSSSSPSPFCNAKPHAFVTADLMLAATAVFIFAAI